MRKMAYYGVHTGPRVAPATVTESPPTAVLTDDPRLLAATALMDFIGLKRMQQRALEVLVLSDDQERVRASAEINGEVFECVVQRRPPGTRWTGTTLFDSLEGASYYPDDIGLAQKAIERIAQEAAMNNQEQRLARLIEAGQIMCGNDHGWSARLARRLDMNRGYMSSIVAGQRDVNDEIERRLSKAIGEWWDQVRQEGPKALGIKLDVEVELARKGGSDAL